MIESSQKPPLWRRLLSLRMLGVAAGLWVLVTAFWVLLWPRGPIPIDPEITFLTEPVGGDGYIDYVAALQPTEIIAAEDNAAGCYLRAAGLNLYAICPSEDVPLLAAQLGVPQADPNEKLIDLDEFGPDLWTSVDVESLSAEDQENWYAFLDKQYRRCLAAPWSANEYPLINDWINANAQPFDLIVEGTSRSRFQFRPRQSGPIYGHLLRLTQRLRRFAQVIACRALNRIELGLLEEAAADIDSLNRLARHLNEKPHTIEVLVGLAIESIAFELERALIPQLESVPTIEHRRAKLATRSPFDPNRDSMHFAERFMSLDMIQHIDREARGLAPAGSGFVPGPALPTYLRNFQIRMIDTTECSRRVNDIYDETLDIFQLPIGDRAAAFKVVRDQTSQLKTVDNSSVMSHLSSSTLNDGVVYEFLSSARAYDEALRRQTTRLKLLDLAYASRLFELAAGKPPASRSDLVPRYLADWPRDDVRDEPLKDATIDGRWRVFFRIPGEEDRAAEKISPGSFIDLPYRKILPDDD